MVMVMVLNEEKKMKQPSVFTGIQRIIPNHIVFIKILIETSNLQRFCLWEKKKTRKQNKELAAQTHKFWKEIKTDEKKVKEFIYSMFKDITSSLLFLDHLKILKILCCFF